MNLPDGDGLELARRLRAGAIDCQSGREIRIVMLTALGTLPDRVRGLDAGADDYIVKPFALAELTARLRAVLRREIRGSRRSCASATSGSTPRDRWCTAATGRWT